MLIRNSVTKQVARIETPNTECIFLKLKHLSSMIFVACYLPPSDSPFHTWKSISEIQERMERDPDSRFVIIGDLNARFGNNRTPFLAGKDISDAHYIPSPDVIASPNQNARYIASILGSKTVLLNGLEINNTTYATELTFRQRRKWISELDVCLLSHQCIKNISAFQIHQEIDLPSDHAPISFTLTDADPEQLGLTDLQHTAERASSLGQHALQSRNNHSLRRKPIRMNQLNSQALTTALEETLPPDLTAHDADTIAQSTNQILYEIALRSKQEESTHDPINEADEVREERQDSRWKEMLADRDSREL